MILTMSPSMTGRSRLARRTLARRMSGAAGAPQVKAPWTKPGAGKGAAGAVAGALEPGFQGVDVGLVGERVAVDVAGAWAGGLDAAVHPAAEVAEVVEVDVAVHVHVAADERGADGGDVDAQGEARRGVAELKLAVVDAAGRGRGRLQDEALGALGEEDDRAAERRDRRDAVEVFAADVEGAAREGRALDAVDLGDAGGDERGALKDGEVGDVGLARELLHADAEGHVELLAGDVGDEVVGQDAVHAEPGAEDAAGAGEVEAQRQRDHDRGGLGLAGAVIFAADAGAEPRDGGVVGVGLDPDKDARGGQEVQAEDGGDQATRAASAEGFDGGLQLEVAAGGLGEQAVAVIGVGGAGGRRADGVAGGFVAGRAAVDEVARHAGGPGGELHAVLACRGLGVGDGGGGEGGDSERGEAEGACGVLHGGIPCDVEIARRSSGGLRRSEGGMNWLDARGLVGRVADDCSIGNSLPMGALVGGGSRAHAAKWRRAGRSPRVRA
jgi:hypothetical protein